MSTISSIEELAEVEDGTNLLLLTTPNANNHRFEDLSGTEVRKEGTQVWIGQAPIPATSLNAALASGLLAGPENWDGTMEVGQAYRCRVGTYFVLGINGDDITYLWLPDEEGGGRKSFATNNRSSLYADVQRVSLAGDDLELAQSALRAVATLVGYASDLEASVTEAREQGRRAGLQEFRDYMVTEFDGSSFLPHEVTDLCEHFGLDGLPPDRVEVDVTVRFTGTVDLDNGMAVNVSDSDQWTVMADEDTCACDEVTIDMISERYEGVRNIHIDERECPHDY